MTKTLTAQDLADTFDAFNRHDVDAVMTHFADDCVFYTVGGDHAYGNKVEGAEAIAKAFSAVWAGMKDAHWDHHSHFRPWRPRRVGMDVLRHRRQRHADRSAGRRPVHPSRRQDRRETGPAQVAPRFQSLTRPAALHTGTLPWLKI